ncbi:MAG TPA: response regulator [Kofleriaceae bacterium]|nr:response regulator [Kofleriaceae bacterium]
MSSPPRILALSDGSALARALAAELAHNSVLVTATTLEDAVRAVRDQAPQAAVVPDRLQTGATGRVLAAELGRLLPAIPVILLTGAPEGSEATLALQLGDVADVVPVPWRPGQLRGAIDRALELVALRAERDRTLEELRELQRRPARAAGHRLDDMVGSMADGLILTDLNSNEVTINPAARQMLGIQADVVVTTQFLKDRLGFYPFDLVVATSTAGVGPPGPLREEVRVGDQVLHSIVSPVNDDDGRLVGVVVVLRDMTETRDLARRQSEFISLVSHELRTPLTSITGALDIVLSDYAGRLTDKQRRYLQMARESCTRLNMTVDDLLDVARSDTGRMPMNFTALDLDALGRAVVDRYRQAAAAKQVDLKVRSEHSIRIVGDPDRLTQVLNNLISNAIKFTPVRGTIEIEIFGPSVAANHVGVSVFNNGDPIAEDDRERIFDKFEQLQASRRVGGTGLGLAISRSIVEAHAGRIWVESSQAGTRFVFTLPAAPAIVETDAVPALEPQAVSAPTDSDATVLVLETDPHATYILKGLLMAAGHEVLVAGDADTALTLARSRHPNLLIVDLSGAPEESLALVEIFEHDPETRKTAVMVLGSESDREAALRAGADDFLPKPIEPDAFRETGARLIAEAGRARAPRILVVDDEPMIRTICRDVLENAGYHVMDAPDGTSAIAVAKRHKPDLMLVDVMMPDLDGFQTAERFRAEPATSLTPVIFLSARGETADKVRAFRIGAEDYVVKPFDAAELVARVAKALERHSRELGASPTTQLPGGDAIEAEVERRLATDGAHAYCYLDLDNLKAFNDYYGYAKADGVIRQTGDLMRDLVAREGCPGDFIGHIAGDDFVFITSTERVDRVCAAIIESFGRLVPLYYNKPDRERGYIETKDRYGVMRRFPIMSVSIAAVTSAAAPRSFSELATAAAVGKKLAKTTIGSSYVRDGELVLGDPHQQPGATGTA